VGMEYSRILYAHVHLHHATRQASQGVLQQQSLKAMVNAAPNAGP
jgi:hypothetical protein